MQRMKKEDRGALLRQAAVDVALETGYSSVTREQVAERGGVSAGLVSRLLGDMDVLKHNIMLDGCAEGNLPIIVEGVIHKEPVARKAAKKYRDAIVLWLFK